MGAAGTVTSTRDEIILDHNAPPTDTRVDFGVKMILDSRHYTDQTCGIGSQNMRHVLLR